MLRRSFPIMILLCLVFLLALPVFGRIHVSAQDVTPESPVATVATTAPVVTATPAPILTPDNAISVSTILYGLIIAVLGGGTVGFVLNRFGSNKANLDSMEKLYLAQSPDAQERERLLFEGLRSITLRVLDIVDKVTDGQPNADVQISPSSINIHAADNEAAANAVKGFLEATRPDSNVG